MNSTQRHEEAVTGPESPAGQTVLLGTEKPLTLDCGVELGPFTAAYETYGKLNEDRSNVILACHALTGDQFVTGTNPISGKSGWWPLMVGPGQPFDTDQYFVVCANVLGGCMGTTGPKVHRSKIGKALRPVVPGHHGQGYGAGAGHAARLPGYPEDILRFRRFDGRHAGVAVDGHLS